MSLVYYPASVFKQKSEIVIHFDDVLLANIRIMQQAMNEHRAIGIGANMCGILQRIIIVPSSEPPKENDTIIMINPHITEKSVETQTCVEASASFPGIDAPITRPQTITVTYQDIHQQSHTLTATGFLSTIIQHEIDYLDAVVYLDYLPKGKARLLREKMQKYMKKTQRHGHNQTHATHNHNHNHNLSPNAGNSNRHQDSHHYHDGKLCTHQH